jgi:gliding motility-associated-like protein
VNINLDTFGTFNIRVREISQFGCAGPWNDTQIIIQPKPKTTPISGLSTICFPKLTGYSYSITGMAGSTYQWWVNGGTFNPPPSVNSTAVTVDWNGQQNSVLSVLETSGFGCLGDTVKLPVFIDNPNIVSRWVTVDPPPADDKWVLVHYKLGNAPRYNRQVVIQRRPRNNAGIFATVGITSPTDTVFTDKIAFTDSTSYEYRAVAINLCGDSLYSNTNTDILLKGLKSGPFSMRLNFTDYQGWSAGVARYELYRLLENKSGYSLYKTYFSPSIDSFDNGKEHYGQYFRVKAIENGGEGRESWSNDIRIFFEPVIFIPNAFSPDGNGLNDKFLPNSGGLKTYNFTIYSRWGEKLFSTTNSEVGWDGNYLGKPCPSGVYVFYCEYTDFRDKIYNTKGTLHLFR